MEKHQCVVLLVYFWARKKLTRLVGQFCRILDRNHGKFQNRGKLKNGIRGVAHFKCLGLERSQIMNIDEQF